LLKGFRSLIAHARRCLVIQAGNSALAKAGTGDVLTGMIGALLAQGLDTPQATATAAYLHGRMADEWVRAGRDKSSLTASDLASCLPLVVSRLRQGGSFF
jgi:NAD(P)H-hydrate repair Nnr-like enzyme with NAD(P)H-hydrate dehydratase domain